MASTGILCSVFLLVAMTCITSVWSAESDDNIFGNDEDKLLLPFVILLLVTAFVVLVFGIVIVYFTLAEQSNKKLEVFEMSASARQPARLSSSHNSERDEVSGDWQYEPNLESTTDNRSYETIRISGEVYDNPVVLDNENTEGYAKKANDSSGSSGKHQKDVDKNEKGSFKNPAYDNVSVGSYGAENDYQEIASPPPMEPSDVEDTYL